jgi:macrolide transport system ATP-binding/permease protein
VTVYQGYGPGDQRSSEIHTLNVSDAEAIAEQPYVDSVTPAVSAEGLLRFGSVNATAVINGVGEQYFRVRNVKLGSGREFDSQAVREYSQEMVIDAKTAGKLFPDGRDPVGEVIQVAGVPFTIIGVTQSTDNAIFGTGETLNVFAPYTTVTARLLRQADLKSITVRVSDGTATDSAEGALTRVLELRHGRRDFYFVSADSVRRTVESVTLMLSLLIGAIGGISLVVGGLGVMNIMLVSVSERTREIGVRTAIGARRSDIMAQFIIEAVLVCLIGGAIGVGLAIGIGAVFSYFFSAFSMIYSPASIIAAFATASFIGLAFGWLPARNAARLDPVVALARE